MKLKVFLLITIFVANFYSILSQNYISCDYSLTISSGYTCNLKIINPNGLNNFSSINGTHLAGMTDHDVKLISSNSQSNTSNVPSILCQKFKNTEIIMMYLSKIKRIDDYSFENCKQLMHLELISNLITEIDEDAFEENTKLEKLFIGINPLTDLPEDLFEPLKNLTVLSISRNQISRLRPEWFESLEKLQSLWIYENPITEFPRNIFKPLTKLIGLYSYNCNLTEISSNSFGIHPQLTTLSFPMNRIEAIDERIIENTNVTNFYMTMNFCADVNITDTTASRQSMRKGLRNCFDNYNAKYPETTTVTSTTTQSTTIPTTTTSESTTMPTTTTTMPTTFPTTTTTEPTTTTESTTITPTPPQPTTVTTTTEFPTTTFHTTTTQTLPPGCNAGNLDERVCKIEDVIEEFHDNFKAIKEEKQELQEALENQNALIAELIQESQQQAILIEELQSELKSKSDNFGATLEELQEQVLILSTRPCSCH